MSILLLQPLLCLIAFLIPLLETRTIHVDLPLRLIWQVTGKLDHRVHALLSKRNPIQFVLCAAAPWPASPSQSYADKMWMERLEYFNQTGTGSPYRTHGGNGISDSGSRAWSWTPAITQHLKSGEGLPCIEGQLQLVTSKPTWATEWDFVFKKKSQE